MNGIERLEDAFPHGTPDGYERGCRGRICRNGRENGQTCRQAFTRYAGDAEYRRLVRGGAAVETLQRPATFAPPERGLGRGLVRGRAPKPTLAAPTKRGRSHGTLAGYRRGCHKASPCPGGADGRTCAEVMAAYQIAWARRKRADTGEREAA